MSLGTDNLEEAKKSEVKGRRRGPECDGFPTDDKKCPTNKPTSDQVLDEIIYNKQALMRTQRDGTSNLHRIATYLSDSTVIDTILKTLKNGNNFKQDSSRQNYLGHSPLFVAILCRNKTFVLKFLQAGVPLNLRDGLGKTIFHYLAERDSEYFANEIFKQVTFQSSEIAPVLLTPDHEGETSAHVAFRVGNTIAFENFYKYGGVQLLLKKDQKREYTLLHMAAEKGDRWTTEFLLTNKEFNLHVDAMGGDEATPLHLAVSNGHIELARYLLDSGADATIPLRECSVLGLVPSECEAEMRALFAQKVPHLYNFLSVASDNYYGDDSDDSDYEC